MEIHESRPAQSRLQNRHLPKLQLWFALALLAVSSSVGLCLAPPPDSSQPSIDDIPNQSILQGSKKLIPIVVGTDPTFSSEWTVSANSANTAVLPNDSLNLFVNGTGTNRTINIKALPGVLGSTEITIRARDARGVEAIKSFILTVVLTNTPPKISQLADIEMAAGVPVSVNLLVSDLETSPNELTLSATSDTDSVIGPKDVVFSGNGTNRVATLTSSGTTSGTVFISFIVSDTDGGRATNTFSVFVTRNNSAPEISTVADQLVDANAASGIIKFNVFDTETALTKLIVTATSDNPSLFPGGNFKLSGDGFDRQLVITPAPNKGGTAQVTLTVKDGIGATASATFLVAVQGADLKASIDAGQLVLRWANLDKFNLRYVPDYSNSLQSPYVWQPVQQPSSLKDGYYQVILPVSSNLGLQIFRLRQVF